METKTKGYTTYLIAVGSEDTYLPDDDNTSVTGGMWNSREGEKYNNRVSLLKDVYTTTRMIGDDPGPERVQRGTGRRVSQSHCLRINRE